MQATDAAAGARIGFLYPEPVPLSPAHWSGTPHALANGLRALEFDVVPIPYRLPRVLRYGVTLLSYTHGRGAIARGAPVKTRVRSRTLAAEALRALPLDALVALGTDLYDLERVAPPGVPVATYDDGTFALFMHHPESDVRRNAFPEREVRRWAERQARAVRRATACCVSTHWAAASMIDDYGVPRDRVHVVGMGHQPRLADATRRDWSRPRFLFVGVDWERKNGAAVVRAFERLRRECPAATLDIVGDHVPLHSEGVRGHGFLPREDPDAQRQLRELYERATAFVLPSRFDPSPVASLEAASAGLPVIITTEGGASELLGDAAIAVHPDDDEALLAALRRLADPDTARRLGAEVAQRAAGLTWLAVAARIAHAVGVEDRESYPALTLA